MTILSRFHHCHRCDVAWRGTPGQTECWMCHTADQVALADGLPDHIRRASPGGYWSWSAPEEDAA